MIKAVCLALLFSAMASAADPCLHMSARERTLYTKSYPAMETGRDLYNAGRIQESIGWYTATLVELKPWMCEGLINDTDYWSRLANAQTCPHKKAYMYRYALDCVMYKCMKEVQPAYVCPSTIVVAKDGGQAAPVVKQVTRVVAIKNPTLWDRLGGSSGVVDFSKKIVERMASDDELKPLILAPRGHALSPDHKDKLSNHLTDLICTLTDGPGKYSWQDLKTDHPDLMMTGYQFDKLKSLVRDELKTRTQFVSTADQDILVELFEKGRSDFAVKK